MEQIIPIALLILLIDALYLSRVLTLDAIQIYKWWRRQSSLRLTFTIGGFSIETSGKETRPMASVPMSVDTPVTATVRGKDKQGNVGAPLFNGTWSVSDASILSIVPGTDGLSCVVSGLKAGAATLLWDGSADLAGAKPLHGSAELVVGVGEAVEVEIGVA